MAENRAPVDIRIIDRANREDVKRLYQEAGWWRAADDADPAWIDRLIRQSFCFAGAFCNDRLVGMGRAISDGVSDAYIQDVTVRADFRHRGIGQQLIRAIVGCLKSHGIGWIALIAEPGTMPFYRRLGFAPMVDYLPMRLPDE